VEYLFVLGLGVQSVIYLRACRLNFPIK